MRTSLSPPRQYFFSNFTLILPIQFATRFYEMRGFLQGPHKLFSNWTNRRTRDSKSWVISMNVLLSIKLKCAEETLSTRKTYEFRKTAIKKADSVEKVILYASSPVQQIVGSFEIGQIISGSPEQLWEQYGAESGIDDREDFMSYYSGKQQGYAIEIKDPKRLQTKIDPTRHIDGFSPPVSFKYVNGEFDLLFEKHSVESVTASD